MHARRFQLCFATPPQYQTGLIVPLFGEYEDVAALWDAAAAAAALGISVLCLMRPSIDDTPRPAESLSPGYTTALAKLVAAGARCLGYVETGECSKSAWLIDNEIRAFATWGSAGSATGLCGMFFDHTAQDASAYSVAYCRRAAQTTREEVGPLVILNPMCVPLSLEYKKWANVVVTFEDVYSAFRPRAGDVPANRVYTRRKDGSSDDPAHPPDETKGVAHYSEGATATDKVASDVQMAARAMKQYVAVIDDDDDVSGSASEWEHDDSLAPEAAAPYVAN